MKYASRGFTLIETMVVLAITMAGIAVVLISLSHQRPETHASLTVITGALDRAHAIAQTTGTGATITATTRLNGQPGFDISVCQGRPYNNLQNCKEEDAIPTAVGLTTPAGAITGPWAMYINNDGSIAAGAYPSGTTEPTCNAGQSVTINLNYAAMTDPTIDCATGHLSTE